MKNRHGPFLQTGPQIDQNVTAADEIEIRERGVPGEVMLGKNAHLPDGFVDLIAAVHLDKETLQTFRRETLGNVLRVSAGPGFVDGPVTISVAKIWMGMFGAFFPKNSTRAMASE